ncbi:hypothetical protein BCV70DRAFT_160216 [Testicularia cyperi]|uniref:Tethering factor for nuclear proteasome STS1 n=1 Tax=Testicularia cyperi TaxID=1882483 RepID=A0A317XQP4_9BASI|nr:hypothetical protein BCV70DRAFT_160216 [Testicularia cyperi]
MTSTGPLAHMSASPSRSSSPALATNPNLQIPFSSAPVHHAPSPLGFGFGFGSSFGGNNAVASASTSSNAFSTPPLTSSTSHFFASPSTNANPASLSPRRSETKRRRDLDDDDDDDEDMGNQQTARQRSGLDSWGHHDRRTVLPKRMRAGLGFGPMCAADMGPIALPASPALQSSHLQYNSNQSSIFSSPSAFGSATSSSAQTPTKRLALGDRGKVGMSGIDVDIGKMLASMDKPALLSMLTSLLSQSQDPSLAAQILSLLPTPSLDSVEASLDELEKAIRSAIPFTADGNAARHEYTWSRLRAPVAAFTDAALGYLPFFVTELDADREQRMRERDPRLQANREEVHPATTFSFLHMLTSRILRIETMLPPVPKASLAFNLFAASSASTSFGFGSPSGFGTPSSAAASPSKLRSPHVEATEMFGKHSSLALKLGSEYTAPASPDTLMSALMPAVLKQWTTLLHRLDKAVNIDGRMFSQDLVLGWAQLIIRQAMDEVRNRLERDLAWLVRGASYHVTTPTLATRSLKKDKRARSSSMSDEEEL